jgi:hypothetical protein
MTSLRAYRIARLRGTEARFGELDCGEAEIFTSEIGVDLYGLRLSDSVLPLEAELVLRQPELAASRAVLSLP